MPPGRARQAGQAGRAGRAAIHRITHSITVVWVVRQEDIPWVVAAVVDHTIPTTLNREVVEEDRHLPSIRSAVVVVVASCHLRRIINNTHSNTPLCFPTARRGLPSGAHSPFAVVAAAVAVRTTI